MSKMINLPIFWQTQIDEGVSVLTKMRHDAVLQQAFSQVLSQITTSLAQGNKLLFIGNGGSAADAQHLAAELVVRFRKNRSALPALALTVDTSALTAIGNDFGFDQVFSRQIQGLGREGDVLFALSTSGQSVNILNAVVAAQALGILVVGMTGHAGGALADLVDICLHIPSDDTARIQEGHTFLGHLLCDALEQSIFP
jgi:D-sedoheptulose 7-phosphate isomerase